MISTRIAACVMILVVAGPPVALHAQDVSCPASITVKDHLETPPPAGWEVRMNGSPRYLAGVTFSDGDP